MVAFLNESKSHSRHEVVETVYDKVNVKTCIFKLLDTALINEIPL